MSIPPISAVNLYQEQINYYTKLYAEDTETVARMLERYGVVPTGDANKDLAKLQELQTKTAAEGLQGLQEEATSVQTQAQQVSYPWYSIMYQLGINPTGDPEQDYKDIMEVLVDKAKNAEDESEFNNYMSIINMVDELFIFCGVTISKTGADSVSATMGMEILASYNKVRPEAE